LTPSGALDILLQDKRFEGNGKFCAVCRLILEQIEHDIEVQGRSAKGLAYDIVSNAMDKYFGKRNGPVPKKDMKAVLDLARTASRTRTAVQLKIYEIYDNLKSRK